MATKKLPTDKELTDTETKLIPLLMNESSDLITLDNGVKIRFQRPSLPGKYRYQVWINKKIEEIGLDASDTESEFLFYWNYFGLVNAHITELILPDGTSYEYNQKVDSDYKFLFEKYVGEELYNKGISEENFVIEVINSFVEWQKETEVTPEELKNS